MKKQLRNKIKYKIQIPYSYIKKKNPKKSFHLFLLNLKKLFSF